MANTKSERAMSLLNYSLASRQSTASSNYISNSYPDALIAIVDIYVNNLSKGAVTPEEVEDFYETLSCANYLDNKSYYPGLDNVILYSQNILSSAMEDKYKISEQVYNVR